MAPNFVSILLVHFVDLTFDFYLNSIKMCMKLNGLIPGCKNLVTQAEIKHRLRIGKIILLSFWNADVLRCPNLTTGSVSVSLQNMT